MDVVADIIAASGLLAAGYAAWTAGAARRWQRDRDEARIELQVAPRSFDVELHVINAGETTEWVSAVWIDRVSSNPRSVKSLFRKELESGNDHQLKPRARYVVPLPDTITSRGRIDEVFIVVRLASGKEFATSLPEILKRYEA